MPDRVPDLLPGYAPNERARPSAAGTRAGTACASWAPWTPLSPKGEHRPRSRVNSTTRSRSGLALSRARRVASYDRDRDVAHHPLAAVGLERVVDVGQPDSRAADAPLVRGSSWSGESPQACAFETRPRRSVSSAWTTARMEAHGERTSTTSPLLRPRSSMSSGCTNAGIAASTMRSRAVRRVAATRSLARTPATCRTRRSSPASRARASGR